LAYLCRPKVEPILTSLALSTSRWPEPFPQTSCRRHAFACRSATANILSAARLPHSTDRGKPRSSQHSPWLCAPILRPVCLFEDDDAAGRSSPKTTLLLARLRNDQRWVWRKEAFAWPHARLVRVHVSESNLGQLRSKSNRRLEKFHKVSVRAADRHNLYNRTAQSSKGTFDRGESHQPAEAITRSFKTGGPRAAADWISRNALAYACTGGRSETGSRNAMAQ
jgi:hypothetical protein